MWVPGIDKTFKTFCSLFSIQNVFPFTGVIVHNALPAVAVDLLIDLVANRETTFDAADEEDVAAAVLHVFDLKRIQAVFMKTGLSEDVFEAVFTKTGFEVVQRLKKMHLKLHRLVVGLDEEPFVVDLT